jgi:hypothetical protein
MTRSRGPHLRDASTLVLTTSSLTIIPNGYHPAVTGASPAPAPWPEVGACVGMSCGSTNLAHRAQARRAAPCSLRAHRAQQGGGGTGGAVAESSTAATQKTSVPMGTPSSGSDMVIATTKTAHEAVATAASRSPVVRGDSPAHLPSPRHVPTSQLEQPVGPSLGVLPRDIRRLARWVRPGQ